MSTQIRHVVPRSLTGGRVRVICVVTNCILVFALALKISMSASGKALVKRTDYPYNRLVDCRFGGESVSLTEGVQVTYQQLLRAVGAYLDGESPERFSFLEVPEGFAVILDLASGKPQLREEYFSYENLMEQADKLARGRRFLGSKRTSGWKLAASSRQDFLRALGYELDDSKAQGILLSEIDDGCLVTYSYLDPAQGYGWRKRIITLRADEIGMILTAAYDRRQKRGFLR